MIQRSKTSDAVADHVLGLMIRGELRPGDRIDLDEVARSVGVSRAPVREALIELERDGLVEMPLHRGAYVAPLDLAAVREGFTLYALLSAVTVQTFMSVADDADLAELDDACRRACSALWPDDYETHARRFRRIVNVRASGPHLRSLLRTFNGLVVAASRLAIEDALSTEQDLLRAEHDAIRSGDADAAVAAAIRHIVATGDQAVISLERRGVLDDGGGLPEVTADRLVPLVGALAGARGGAGGAGEGR